MTAAEKRRYGNWFIWVGLALIVLSYLWKRSHSDQIPQKPLYQKVLLSVGVLAILAALFYFLPAVAIGWKIAALVGGAALLYKEWKQPVPMLDGLKPEQMSTPFVKDTNPEGSESIADYAETDKPTPNTVLNGLQKS